MYCSMRFFLERDTPLDEIGIAVQAMTLIKNALHLPCTYIEYGLLDPDYNFKYYYHETKTWKSDVMPFEGVPEIKMLYGKRGDKTVPYIYAGDCISRFNTCRIGVWYPTDNSPTIVKIDFLVIRSRNEFFEYHKELVRLLHSLGVFVNNSFVHVYSNRSDAETLDGAVHSSFRVFINKDLNEHYHEHARAHWINHVFDIFCSNSIALKCLDEDTITDVSKLVGSSNTAIIDNSFIFALPNIEKISEHYRISNKKMINTLRIILKENWTTHLL